MTTPLLHIPSLSVSFGKLRVLHDVSLSLAPGEALALVGESGSGKSVLARSILRCAGTGAQLDGSVFFHGENLLTASEQKLNSLRGSKISLMLQDALSALNPLHTVGWQMMETIALKHPAFVEASGQRKKGEGKNNKQALRALALELLREAGLDRAERRAVQRGCSHGEWRGYPGWGR